MPFSTGQSLSFSQINSSNYAAPPPEINPEAIVPPSRNRNGEVRCRWCNLSKAVAASPIVLCVCMCFLFCACFFFVLRLSCFNLQERFSAFELWRMWVQLWVPQAQVRLIRVSSSKCISEEAVTWYDDGVKEFLMWSESEPDTPLQANSLISSSQAKCKTRCKTCLLLLWELSDNNAALCHVTSDPKLCSRRKQDFVSLRAIK